MKGGVLVVCASLLVVCASLLFSGGQAVAADRGKILSIRRGFAKSFALSGAAPRGLQPVRVRETKIGPSDAGPGEITVGLAPPGGAVSVAKLHVFERVRRSVTFSVAAMRGGRRLATEKVCGYANFDTWVALPAGTTTAIIDQFVEGDCK